MKNMVNWFEIPVKDIERAKKFYEMVFDVKLQDMPMNMEGYRMYVFEHGKDTVSGALVQGAGYTPSHDGTLIYMNGGDDLSGALGKVAEAGGKVLQDKFAIGEYGFVAYFEDSEGNKLALHSMK